MAKSDDSDCLGSAGISITNRMKSITLIVKPSISYEDYVKAVLVTLGSIGAFYFVFVAGFIFCSKRSYVPKQMEYVSCEVPTPSTTCTYLHSLGHPDSAGLFPGAEAADDISLDETEYDVVSESDQDRGIRLRKSVIYLSDLARMDPRVHKYKSYLYLYNVLTVALFYGLPVIQLVVTYQRVLNETGQQDLCYYNFLCAHPVGVISDFNHVFSNSGYVLLGLLFLVITYRREILHKDLNFDRVCKIAVFFL